MRTRLAVTWLGMLFIMSSMAGAPATVVWKTDGSITFASALDGEVWLIAAEGGLAEPRASLVRVQGNAASRVVTFRGRAFSPTADETSVYVVVDHDVVRVDRKPPHATKVLAKREVWPIGTAVDGEFVYFTNQSTQGLAGGPPGGKPGSVARVKKTGGAVERLAEATARDLAVDAENVYFATEDRIRVVSKRGGKARTLVDQVHTLSSLSLDGDWLVYTTSRGASRVNTRTRKIEPLADGIDIPLFVAAGRGVAYLAANMSFPGPKPAEVLRLQPGKPPERLWSGLNRVTMLVLANGALYFSVEPIGAVEGSTLMRLDVPRQP